MTIILSLVLISTHLKLQSLIQCHLQNICACGDVMCETFQGPMVHLIKSTLERTESLKTFEQDAVYSFTLTVLLFNIIIYCLLLNK